MHPILFTLPWLDFPVRSFGLMLALGFLLGSTIFNKLVARHSKDPAQDVERYGAIPVWVLIGIVLGARLLYVIVEVSRYRSALGAHPLMTNELAVQLGVSTGREYLADPLQMLLVWKGGLVMYGGFIGGIVGGTWCAKRHKLRIRHAVDLGITAGFFGQAVGRIGCLLVGDDFGSRVGDGAKASWLHWRPIVLGDGGEIGPFTIRVPNLTATGHLPEGSLFGDENAGQVLWATQPLMSLKALIVASIALWVLKHRRYEGQVALVAVLIYALMRFAIEFLRGDNIRGVWFDGAISTSQMLSIAGACIATILLLKNWNRRDAPLAA